MKCTTNSEFLPHNAFTVHTYTLRRKYCLWFNRYIDGDDSKIWSCVHIEITNKMQHSVTIYYSMFIWSSTCFGRHTAHHQELKTLLAVSGFAYVEGVGRWSCWMLKASSNLNVSKPCKLSRMQNQRMLVQFWAPDDGRCVVQNMLSFI
jgi:hypothetical protein